jgi:hypothetical protein
MNPEVTLADFLNAMNGETLDTTPKWTQGNTVLTCTPVQTFPANTMVVWMISGESAVGEPFAEEPSGFFTTGSGSGTGTGSGTNASTGFVVGITHNFTQTNSIVTPDLEVPYSFGAITSLASNRTATSISLKLPTNVTTNLMQNPIAPEDFFMVELQQDLNALNTSYPPGNYVFTVLSGGASLPVTVSFPASLQQPNAPKVSNYAEAQIVNPAQAFTLQWEAFQGGTTADFIVVNVGTNFSTADLGEPGSLNGTATSVALPAGKLVPNSAYDATVGFYRALFTTNAPNNYTTTAYRATLTHFVLKTSSGQQSTKPNLVGSRIESGKFTFDVTSAPNQPLTVKYSPTMLPGSWLTLLTTNSPGGLVRIVDPRPLATPGLFYQVVSP